MSFKKWALQQNTKNKTLGRYLGEEHKDQAYRMEYSIDYTIYVIYGKTEQIREKKETLAEREKERKRERGGGEDKGKERRNA